MEEVLYNDFLKIQLRVWTITRVEEFPEAINPSYKLRIDFGAEIGVKKSSAQITTTYSMDDLLKTQVLAVVNFAPKQIGPFMSECLVTWFTDEEWNIILARPQVKVPNWSYLH